MPTLKELRLENFCGFKLLNLAPTANYVEILGSNGVGKTRVMLGMLVGADPDALDGGDPVSYGETRASAASDYELDNGSILTVTRSWRTSGDGTRSTQIKVEKIDGEDVTAYKDAKPILAKLFGPFADVREILSIRTPTQERELGDSLLRAAGVSVAEHDAVIAKATEERTGIGARLKSLRARHEAMRVPRPGLPESETSVAGAAAEIAAWRDHRAAYAASARDVAMAAGAVDAAADKVTRLRLMLVEAESAHADAAAKHEAAAGDHAGLDLPPTPEQIQSAEEAMGRLEGTNAEVRAAATWRELVGEIETADTELASAVATIDAARQSKLAALTTAKLPIPGLSITEDGGIAYEGIGLHELSDGQKFTVGVGIGLATMGSVKALFVDRGESIDAANRAKAAAMCEAAGVMLVICRTVDESAELVIRGAEYRVEKAEVAA